MLVMALIDDSGTCRPRWLCDYCHYPLGPEAAVIAGVPMSRHHEAAITVVCGGSCEAMAEASLTARPLHRMPFAAFLAALLDIQS